jgi:hypothetical protein
VTLARPVAWFFFFMFVALISWWIRSRGEISESFCRSIVLLNFHTVQLDWIQFSSVLHSESHKSIITKL